MLGAAKSPPGFVGCGKQPAKMAEAASDVVTFDILEGIYVDSNSDILDSLTEEERAEVTNVVTLLDCANEDSLQHFEVDENTASANRHKKLSNEELDRLAGKNSAQATSYQTKWAVAVIRDK